MPLASVLMSLGLDAANAQQANRRKVGHAPGALRCTKPWPECLGGVVHRMSWTRKMIEHTCNIEALNETPKATTKGRSLVQIRLEPCREVAGPTRSFPGDLHRGARTHPEVV